MFAQLVGFVVFMLWVWGLVVLLFYLFGCVGLSLFVVLLFAGCIDCEVLLVVIASILGWVTCCIKIIYVTVLFYGGDCVHGLMVTVLFVNSVGYCGFFLFCSEFVSLALDLL